MCAYELVPDILCHVMRHFWVLVDDSGLGQDDRIQSIDIINVLNILDDGHEDALA